MLSRSLSRRPALLALGGTTVAAVVAGACTYGASGKTVTVSVDGVGRQVHTHHGTVADVLAAAGLQVGPHDLLAPAAGAHVADGGRVVLRRGRELSMSVDGQERLVWTTARSVQEALDQVGLRTQGARLSADRSRPLPLRGMALDVRLPKRVTVTLAGARPLHVTTTADTVGDVVRALRLRPSASDRLSVPAATRVTDGLQVALTRVVVRQVGSEVPVPFGTTTRPDPAHDAGQRTVLQAGRPGVLGRVRTVVFTDGRITSNAVTRTLQVRPPTTQVVAVGTRVRPVPPPAAAPAARSSSGGSSGGSSVGGSGGGGGLDWAALARCESGDGSGSVSASGRYRGLYQFDAGTWASVGGSGDPAAASRSEQTARAQMLYAREGRAPWPVCGRYL